MSRMRINKKCTVMIHDLVSAGYLELAEVDLLL